MKFLKRYSRTRTYRITLVVVASCSALLYLTLYLNNPQYAQNKALTPISDELTALGFDLHKIRMPAHCSPTQKGMLFDPNFECRASSIESLVPYDEALRVTYAAKAQALQAALDKHGWKQESFLWHRDKGPQTISLVELQNYVGPGKTETVAYHKLEGRTSCLLRVSTDDRFAVISLLVECSHTRHLFIF